MGGSKKVVINAWACYECGEIYLSRIKADLCCDTISESSEVKG